MVKILVIQNEILHYRKSFYEKLSGLYDVTILHSGKSMVTLDDSFSEIIVDAIRIGPFYFQSKVLQYASEPKYDIVIAMFDIRWINSIKTMYKLDMEKPWIWWGLDKGLSSTKLVSRIALSLKVYIAKRNNPIIFYSNRIKDDFADYGLNENNLFVANNTFHISDRIKAYEYQKKEYFINVGSLVPRKRNKEFIEVIAKLRKTEGKDIRLMLIGSGEEESALKDYIKMKGVEDLVEMPGAIKDPHHLREYYKKAIASVSFGQAGLAVLQSMAFGVPFVTSKNSITGGEAYNIINGVNGLLCEPTIESLENNIVRLCEENNLALELGRNAYRYYSENCKIENMVKGFVKAIEN